MLYSSVIDDCESAMEITVTFDPVDITCVLQIYNGRPTYLQISTEVGPSKSGYLILITPVLVSGSHKLFGLCLRYDAMCNICVRLLFFAFFVAFLQSFRSEMGIVLCYLTILVENVDMDQQLCTEAFGLRSVTEK